MPPRFAYGHIGSRCASLDCWLERRRSVGVRRLDCFQACLRRQSAVAATSGALLREASAIQ